MLYRAIVSLVVVLVVVSGCATTYPKDPESQVEYWIRLADDSISNRDIKGTGISIMGALSIPVAPKRLREYLASNRNGQDLFRKYLAMRIDEVAALPKADSLLALLKQVQSTKMISDDETASLIANLHQKVLDGNLSGSVLVSLNDNLDNFPALKSPEHQKVILDRTIQHLQQGSSGSRLAITKSLLEYVKQVGVTSQEGRHIESLLSTFNIRGDEIDNVAKVFPEFAKARRDKLFGRAVLQFKNIDRLSSDDLAQAIKQKVKGIDWVSAPDQKTTVLVVERVRNDEKVIPERTQTITYAQHQVNLISAAWFMPRNSSYMYDLISGGSEIDYGYVVTALVDGKQLSEEVVRGKVGGEYQRCQNARIQNVFGGVSPADFVANDHMASTCNGRQAIFIDDMRRDVLDKVADGVLNVPSIKKFHDLH